MLRKIDPLVRLILAATLLATVLPVTGELRGIAQTVSDVAVFSLFFLYGLRLSRGEVLRGLSNHRLLIPLILWVFGAMAGAGWLLWQAGGSSIPAALGLGFLFLGVLPSTIQSATVYSSLAGGNIASSVVAAALINILGVFISAPLFSLLAGSAGADFQSDSLVKVMTLLLLPFIAGQVMQMFVRGWVAGHRQLIVLFDRSTIAIAVYVAFSGAVEQGIWQKVGGQDWAWLVGGCAIMLLFGYAGSWLVGGAMKLTRGDRIVMLFAGAQKSIAMGAPLATVLFPASVAGIILLPLLLYHLVQMVVAAPIAARLRQGAE